MEHPTRLAALVERPYEGLVSRHFVGLPPLEPGEPDTRRRMAVARVLVLSSRPDGIFLDRFDESGAEAGDTWHRSVEDAQAQAVAEYGENLGAWIVVPSGEEDPVAFGLRLNSG